MSISAELELKTMVDIKVIEILFFHDFFTMILLDPFDVNAWKEVVGPSSLMVWKSSTCQHKLRVLWMGMFARDRWRHCDKLYSLRIVLNDISYNFTRIKEDMDLLLCLKEG